MKRLELIPFLLLLCMLAVFPEAAISLDKLQSHSSEKLALVKAVMCEDVQANAPKNPTVVFSVAREKVLCFTTFDPVQEKTYIYHRWYHREIPNTNIKLTLKPPRWSTFSSIQLRETDRGPWRVEIIDADGNIIQTLRFSILE